MGTTIGQRVPLGVDRDAGIVVEQVRCEPGNLSYVVGCLATRKAAIVDSEPAGAEAYRAALRRHGLRVAMVVDTHTHVDHVSLSRELAAEQGCPIVMHECSQTHRVTRRVRDGDELGIGALRADVWHCPGHTRDMIVLLVAGRLLSADTLFIGAVGRSDLPGGDHRRQWASLRRLMTLPDDTVVLPGHDYSGASHTTIGAEREANARLALDEEAFVADALGRLDAPFPDRFAESIRANTR